MPATLSFTFPSSETVLWESRADALAFFQSIQVPDAGLTTPGVVKKAASMTFANFTAFDETGTWTVNFGDGDHEVPEIANYNELKTKVLSLSAGLNSLLATLRNAGLLNS